MSDNATPSEGTKGKKLLKGTAFGCLGILLVIVLLAIFIDPKEQTPATGSLPATTLDTASASSSIPPSATSSLSPEPVETSSSGIGTSRDELEGVLDPVGFTFERVTAVRGVPRVMGKARSINCIVELMGPEENLSGANAVALISRNESENTVALGSLYLMAMTVDKQSSEWIMEQIKNVKTGQSTTESRVFGGATFALTIDLNETLPMVSLKITD